MSAQKKQKKSSTLESPASRSAAGSTSTRALRSHARKTKSATPPPSKSEEDAAYSAAAPRRSPRIAGLKDTLKAPPLSLAAPLDSRKRSRSRSRSPALPKAMTDDNHHTPLVSSTSSAAAAAASSSSASSSKLERKGSDMYAFYNNCAGQSQIPYAEMDQFGNAQGIDYDLGKEGAFAGYRILVGQFCQPFPPPAEEQYSGRALRAKGFTVDYVHDEVAFCSSLKDKKYDVAWVVSGETISASCQDFEKTLMEFHGSGGGLFIFGDNAPYYAHANAFLEARFKASTRLSGCYWATKMLQHQSGQHNTQGYFGDHFIFTGIQTLYEGHTICHPTTVPAPLTTLATATDGNPCIAVYDPISTAQEALSSSSNPQGRVVVDCGFTKLYLEWDEAGAARYIVNASCWLVGIEKNTNN